MLSMPVFAFGSPKNKNHHVVLGGENIENYFKIFNCAKWCSGLQMPALLVLRSLQREQMRHGLTLPCFMRFQVRLLSLCPLLLPALAGAAVPYGSGAAAPAWSHCSGDVCSSYPCMGLEKAAWFIECCLVGERGPPSSFHWISGWIFIWHTFKVSLSTYTRYICLICF